MSKLITGQDCRIGFDFQHVFQYENHVITIGKLLLYIFLSGYLNLDYLPLCTAVLRKISQLVITKEVC